MSNLKLVAGTVKRRGIALAAVVAVAGGSFATANNAMAVEVSEETSTFDPMQSDYWGTEAGNAAAEAAAAAAKALQSGAANDQVAEILNQGLKKAAGAEGADFTEEDLTAIKSDELKQQLQDVVDSGKATLANKQGIAPGQPKGPDAPVPQAPAQSPEAKWATPAPAGDPSLQRLEAEFGGTEAGRVAQETAKLVAKALRTTGDKQVILKIVKDGLKEAGFDQSQIAQHENEIDELIVESFQRHNEANLELQEKKSAALRELSLLTELNSLQREIFQKQIADATSVKDVNTVLTAAKAEDKNPVQQFAPVPGQKSPGKTGEKTDVEKALEYTKQEALRKLEGFGFLTPQQKDAYTKAVKEATEVYQVEAAFETGEAKNKANEEAKNAKNFVGKALARTKQLALKQLDEMTGLNHEQKREARKKIVDADQVYKVEAAFHTAEKLNSAKK